MCKKVLLGLIPSLVLFALTAVAAPVTFTDANLAAAVRTQWEAATGLTLSTPPDDTELANSSFTELDASGLGITSLTGLEACTSLTTLTLARNSISSLTPIQGLTGLTYLEIGSGDPFGDDENADLGLTNTNQITDLSPLTSLTGLTYLGIAGNPDLSDISAISSLNGLQMLVLGNNNIGSFTPLQDVGDTLQFFISSNAGLQNADVATLNTMTSLLTLAFLAESNLSDLSGLNALTSVNTLLMESLPITSLGFLSNFTALQLVSIVDTDITSLTGVSGLTSLANAYFPENLLTDISALNGLTGLQELDLSDNAIVTIDAIASLTGLTGLSLNGNQITDLTPIVNNTDIGGEDELDVRNNPLTQTAACNQIPTIEARFTTGLFQYNTVCGYELTMTVVGTGNVSPAAGVTAYETDEVIGLLATPVDGSSFAFNEWQGDVTGTDYFQSLTMDSDKSVTAEFLAGDHTLTLSHTGSGAGVTRPVNVPGAYSYLDGRTVFLDAVPGLGSYFGGWQGDISGFAFNTSVIMTADKNVTAVYGDAGWDLTIALNGQGSTTPSADVYRYVDGATVRIQAFGDPGYRFSEWVGPIGEANPNNSILEITLTQDTTITAVFVAEGDGEGEGEGEGEGAVEGEGEGAVVDEFHSADQNSDNVINLSELLRVIQFFNSAGYQCADLTEDGFAPGSGATGCTPHDSDYNPQDWKVGISELLRIIQFYNSTGYNYCPDEVPATEDGFCVGAPVVD